MKRLLGTLVLLCSISVSANAHVYVSYKGKTVKIKEYGNHYDTTNFCALHHVVARKFGLSPKDFSISPDPRQTLEYDETKTIEANGIGYAQNLYVRQFTDKGMCS